MEDTKNTLLTPAQAAERLGVGVDAIQRYFDAGQLEGFVLPSGHRRIYSESVEKLRGNRG